MFDHCIKSSELVLSSFFDYILKEVLSPTVLCLGTPFQSHRSMPRYGLSVISKHDVQQCIWLGLYCALSSFFDHHEKKKRAGVLFSEDLLRGGRFISEDLLHARRLVYVGGPPSQIGATESISKPCPHGRSNKLYV